MYVQPRYLTITKMTRIHTSSRDLQNNIFTLNIKLLDLIGLVVRELLTFCSLGEGPYIN